MVGAPLTFVPLAYSVTAFPTDIIVYTLAGNMLTSFPEEVQRLKKLRVLDITRNPVNGAWGCQIQSHHFHTRINLFSIHGLFQRYRQGYGNCCHKLAIFDGTNRKQWRGTNRMGIGLARHLREVKIC